MSKPKEHCPTCKQVLPMTHALRIRQEIELFKSLDEWWELPVGTVSADQMDHNPVHVTLIHKSSDPDYWGHDGANRKMIFDVRGEFWRFDSCRVYDSYGERGDWGDWDDEPYKVIPKRREVITYEDEW